MKSPITANPTALLSDNGETRVEIFLEQDENGYTKIWVTKNGEQREYYNYKYACEMDGIAYVGCVLRGGGTFNSDWYNLWERAYNIWVCFTDYIYFIDRAALRADVESKLSHLKDIPSYTAFWCRIIQIRESGTCIIQSEQRPVWNQYQRGEWSRSIE